MEFKFDADQEYQIRAIESVVGLLEGQPRIEVELFFPAGASFATIPNRLDLDGPALLGNLEAVQVRNSIQPDKELKWIEAEIDVVDGKKVARFANFSVEMETGTGKTYVYLRTALELFRCYGLRKFIVVVPSVAIREGVLKTLRITERHFRELYGNPPYRYYVYDSANISQVRQFALSDGTEIMIMTIDAFNKAANVIRQTTDRLQGETPIHLVQGARPILILDEPQNMESEKSVEALAALNPLFALRYSATHRNPYNVVYRLTPFEAFRQGLVKKIEVASVVEDDSAQVYLRVDGITVQKRTITARLAVHKLMQDGTIREQVVTVRPGDSLAELAQRPEYSRFEVNEINPGTQTVLFANGVELGVGESRGADREGIFKAQIRYTIEDHFRKQARLREHGIKVLSLFFIDRVANYADRDGMIRRIFEEAFEDLKARHQDWRARTASEVQAAYFAQSRRRTGEVVLEDSSTGTAQKDEAAYDLIMRDKERLLSFDEPVSFIFSHSALREGWDNPNVFQICTLNQTTSEIKKRQEVGRGVRLAVNQEGQRIWDGTVNLLTVVANESYQKYVATLQQEIEDEYGKEGVPPKPANARKRAVASLRKAYLLRPEFQQLWQRIKHKTRYAVKVDTEKLVADVVAELDSLTIRPPRITVTKATVTVGQADVLETMQTTATLTAASLSEQRPLPDLLGLMTHLIEHTSPPVRLSRKTLLEIVKHTLHQEAMIANPQEFATAAVQIIKDRIADHLVNGIQYTPINEWYQMELLQAEIESWEDYLVPAAHSVYDHVVYDSDVEKAFVEGLEKRDDVKLYLKLPDWFKVPTPVGEYNPDWAIVMEERDMHGQPTGKDLLYLVRETKSTTRLDHLRPDERRKIVCGEKHFKEALGVDYRVVTSASDLP